MLALRAHPTIFVPAMDYDRLFAMAEGNVKQEPDVATFLLRELERASTNAPENPEKIVRMQSHVRYRQKSTGQVREVQIVYPHQADPAAGRISILTPVGVALIGLSEGQSIEWKDRNGKRKSLIVLNVRNVPDSII